LPVRDLLISGVRLWRVSGVHLFGVMPFVSGAARDDDVARRAPPFWSDVIVVRRPAGASGMEVPRG
jgi:hypothetical protein